MRYDMTGIRRSVEFSPNHIDNDWMILKLTADEFTRRGYAVRLVEENEIGTIRLDSPVIFNMCQGARANRILQEIADNGSLIINPPHGVLNCHRHQLVSILQREKIPFPKSFLIRTAEPAGIPEEALALGRLWVKRGDVHATQTGDVSLVHGREAIRQVLQDFHRRGIREAILQEHLEGPTIKFYAVYNDGFFRWYQLNGDHQAHLDEEEVYRLAEAAATALDLDIYGGDGIATSDGQFKIIDVNDWPSYARFRDIAAGYIVKHILKKAEKYGKL